MIFRVDEELFRLFPSLKIGVLVCEIDNMKYGDDQLEEVLHDIEVHFSFERPQDHPHVKAWREAFKKVGIPATKYQSSIESLLKRALKGGPFPRINPLVDLYNAVSLRHLVPIGGHSLDAVDGDISLCFAKGGESFVPLDLGEAEVVDKGEVVYKDEKDVLTRRWVWRQCYKDRVENQTTHILIPVDIMEGLPEWLCESVVKDMEEKIIRNDYGKTIHKDVLTRINISTQFSY